MTMTMTEDQIERQVERMVDRIDAAFMAGKFNQAEYDRRMKEVSKWADAQYAFTQSGGRLLYS